MAIDKDLLVVIRSSGLGDGEPDLGEKLMKGFLTTLLETAVPERMIFMNSGVFLTTQGSPVIDLLKSYVENGTEILSCGTCLAYYGRQEKLVAGRATNMKETVSAMLSFKKILQP